MGYNLKCLAHMFPHDVKMPGGIEDLKINFITGDESIVATTEPITIISEYGGSADIGRFQIDLPLSRMNDYYNIRIFPLDEKHPHISEDQPCWGDRNISLLKATIGARDWEALLSICVEFLKSYNPEGAYFVLFGERYCPLCERYCFDDDILSCRLCGRNFCSCCGEDVEAPVDGQIVFVHVCCCCYEGDDSWCPECELFVIEGSHCRYCGGLVHYGCQESHEENCEKKPVQDPESQPDDPTL